MAFEDYVKYLTVPPTEITVREARAGILRLKAHREFSPEHTLDLLICKPTLYETCGVSSKLLPLVVAMSEKQGDEKFNDVYSFDDKGVCLCHGYSRSMNGQRTIDEQHDTDISRLVEQGSVIRDLLWDVPLPHQLSAHTTVIDLRNNSLTPAHA